MTVFFVLNLINAN